MRVGPPLPPQGDVFPTQGSSPTSCRREQACYHEHLGSSIKASIKGKNKSSENMQNSQVIHKIERYKCDVRNRV